MAAGGRVLLTEALLSGLIVARSVITLLDTMPMDEDVCDELSEAMHHARKLAELLAEPYRPGRGRSLLPRLPTVALPRREKLRESLRFPDTFHELCGLTPTEFMSLHSDVEDVLLLARNLDGTYSESENRVRRKHAYKYSSEERLFHLLLWMREYRTFRKFAKSARGAMGQL